MTRDAEMPAREYLDLVLRHAERESNPEVLRHLLSQAAAAVTRFGDPANREPGLQRLADGSRGALERAEPGSDAQLAWTRSFISSATSEEQLADVRGLLEGSTTFEGLAVDTELRWQIVQALASSGTDDAEELIAAEQRRDPTDLGSRHAETARAARPTREGKEEAWTTITEGRRPLAVLEDIERGFQQPTQERLLEPFAHRFFEALPEVWEKQDFQVALSFGEGMYPHAVVDETVVSMTDEYLRRNDVPGPLRRQLLEGKDGIERALRARQLDRTAD